MRPPRVTLRGVSVWLSAAALGIGFLALMLLSMARKWAWPDGSDWQELWTFATFAVAITAASIALRQLRAHHDAQWERSRPYVIVDWEFRSTAIFIEVRNSGATTARDLKLKWSPNLVAGDKSQAAAVERNLVEGVVPSLAPGRSIRHFIGTWDECMADQKPPRYEVQASYRDSSGRRVTGEVMLLDLHQWTEAIADPDYDNRNWNESKRQTEALKAAGKGIRAISKSLDQLVGKLEDLPGSGPGS